MLFRSAGFAASYQFDDLEEMASDLPRIMNEKGPVFVALKVNHPDELPEFYMGNTGEAMKRLASNLSSGA